MTVSGSPQWLRRLFYGASVGALANAVSQLGTFLIGLYIARLTGPTSFGLWAIAYSTLLTVVSLSTLGINLSTARFTAELRKTAPQLADTLNAVRLINLVLTLGILIPLALFADIIAAELLRNPAAGLLIRIGSLFAAAASLASFWTGVLAGYEAYNRIFFNNLTATILLLTLGVVATQRLGLPGTMGAVSAAAGLALLLHRRSARRLSPVIDGRTVSLRKLPWRRVLAVSGPAAISGLLTTLAIWISQTLLVRAEGGEMELGLFAAANGLRSLALLGLSFLASAALVIISSERSEQGPSSYARMETRMHWVLAISSLVATLLMIAASGPLVRLYGPGFGDAESVVEILAWSVVIEAVGMGFYNHLMVQGRLVENLWIAVLPREAARLSLAITLLPLGAVGLAYAFLASASVFTFTSASQVFMHRRRAGA